MTITLHSNNEGPDWRVTATVNGALVDYFTGYTFTCVVLTTANAVLLTKTTGITGAAAGVITVAFTGAELVAANVTATAADPVATYKLLLTPRLTAGSIDGPTIEETLTLRWRP